MSSSLPQELILSEENDLLVYNENNGNVELCKVAEIFDLKAKFSMENSNVGHGLVHIRSCYNNKYWTRTSREGNTESYIDPSLKEAMEDKDSHSCTLFRVEKMINTVSFIHVQTGFGVCILPHVRSLGIKESCKATQFHIIDYESLVKLPRYVAFKGDNGKFLAPSSKSTTRISQHSFRIDKLSDKRIVYEIIPKKNGCVMVKNNWTKEPGFEVKLVKATKANYVCLQHPRKNIYYGRKTLFGLKGMVNLGKIGPNMDSEAELEVVEPVLNRRIDHVELRCDHDRVYDLTPKRKCKETVSNNSDEVIYHNAEFLHTKTSTRSWDNFVMKFNSVHTSFNISYGPLSLGHFEISTESTEKFKWGEFKVDSVQIKSVYSVAIPPRQKSTINVEGTEGTCEIPFSYVQTDTFYDGEKIVTYHDGIYSTTDTLDFKHECLYEPI